MAVAVLLDINICTFDVLSWLPVLISFVLLSFFPSIFPKFLCDKVHMFWEGHKILRKSPKHACVIHGCSLHCIFPINFPKFSCDTDIRAIKIELLKFILFTEFLLILSKSDAGKNVLIPWVERNNYSLILSCIDRLFLDSLVETNHRPYLGKSDFLYTSHNDASWIFLVCISSISQDFYDQ